MDAKEAQSSALHILFFPLMAPGHMIPMIDIAKLFAARGVRATILTTPSNAAAVSAAVKHCTHNIHIYLLPAAGLPYENAAAVGNQADRVDFFISLSALRMPFSEALKEIRPDAAVTDMFFPWTATVAGDFEIPVIVFHGTSYFDLCVEASMMRHRPHAKLHKPSDKFLVPDLPHEIIMSKSQTVDLSTLKPEFADLLYQVISINEETIYGVLANSFYELEPDYVNHYRNFVGIRSWHVGPVNLCNTDLADQSARGGAAAEGGDYLAWLDEKKDNSVLYICFGSMFTFPHEQLRELALGLMASRRPFLWVVRCSSWEWLPERFEKRAEGKIITGWAPQMVILGHAAVGGFMTHCGWNSSLEAIAAGKPVVTWPLFADQFNNERLMVDVLRIGVAVGSTDYVGVEEDVKIVRGEEVHKAVEKVMGDGGEQAERRRRAAELGGMARRAVEEGGSSYTDMGNLIHELMERKKARQ